MATKEKFDMVVMSLGYQKFAVPRNIAMQFFDMCVGQDMYKIDHVWENNETLNYACLLEDGAYPTISTISPAYFHQLLENNRQREERKREEAKKKAAA